MSRRSRSRVPRHARVAGVSATAVALLGAVAAAPSAAAPSTSEGAGLSGWWYDALVVEEAHRETTGEGATIVMGDTAIDTTVPELRGTDLSLEGDCRNEPTRSVTRPAAQHGTTMASLILGTGRGNGPGGKGIAGIAPDARLLFHNLDPAYTALTLGFDCESNIMPSYEKSLEKAGEGPIFTWSIGGMAQGYEELQLEIERAGGVSIAAAGDRFDPITRGVIDYPAGIPGFVAVLALDEDAQPADLNPARFLEDGVKLGYPTISAPGVDIPSLKWQGDGWQSGVPQTGTSHATALVAGALALVKSKYPEATGNQLIQHLIHYDTDPEKFTWSEEFGFGIVSLRNMLAHDPAGWPDVNPLRVQDPEHPTGHRQPEKVLKKFPMSVYDPDRGGDTAEADAAGVTADDEATEAAGSETQAPEAPSNEGEGGVPVAVWVASGVVAMVALGAGAVLARRTKTSE